MPEWRRGATPADEVIMLTGTKTSCGTARLRRGDARAAGWLALFCCCLAAGCGPSQKVEYDELIRDSNDAIARNPRDATAHHKRGLAHGMKGRHEEAIQDFTKAIELDPKMAAAHYDRGTAHLRTGRTDEAIQEYT